MPPCVGEACEHWAEEFHDRMSRLSLLADGLISPTGDDVIRIALLALAIANVVVLGVAVRTLRTTTRLLLDVEQFAREIRREARDRNRVPLLPEEPPLER